MNDKQKTQIINYIKGNMPRISKSTSVKVAEAKLSTFIEKEFAKNPVTVQEWERTFWDEIEPAFGFFRFHEVGTPPPPAVPTVKQIGASCLALLPHFLLLKVHDEYFGDHPIAAARYAKRWGMAFA